MADRVALREVGAGAAWDEAFLRYLEEQECPIDLRKSPARKPSALDWLVSQAVGFQYKDNAAGLNAVKGAPAGGGGGAQAPAAGAASAPTVFSDGASRDTRKPSQLGAGRFTSIFFPLTLPGVHSPLEQWGQRRSGQRLQASAP